MDERSGHWYYGRLEMAVEMFLEGLSTKEVLASQLRKIRADWEKRHESDGAQ